MKESAKQYVLKNFLNNSRTINNMTKLTNLSSKVADQNQITRDEAAQIFEHFDYELLMSGVKSESILVMRGLIPSEHNVIAFIWAMRKKFFVTEDLERLTIENATPLTVGLALNDVFTPQLTTTKPYLTYEAEKHPVFKQYQTNAIKNDAMAFANQFLTQEEMISYHKIQLLKNLIKFEKPAVSSGILSELEELISLKNEAEIINSYDDFSLLPELINYALQSNPAVIELIGFNIMRDVNTKYTNADGESLLKLINLNIDSKLEEISPLIESVKENTFEKTDMYAMGYQQALIDLQNSELTELTDKQTEFIEEHKNHDLVEYEITNDVLLDKSSHANFQVIYDGELI